MIDARAAASAARAAVRHLHGPGHDAARAALEGASLESPLLVTRVDRPGRSFYLAPWRSEHGVVLVAQIDAVTGALNSVAALPNPVCDFVMPKEQARSLARARKGRVIGDPQLVWQPCRESTSPLQPLYRVLTEQGEAYVSMDGDIHDQLTPLGRGG